MMKIFPIILSICFCYSSSGQVLSNTGYETEINGRIHLKEKANQSLYSLPQLLLSAFCRGDLKAYYPGRPDIEMTFPDFVAYFGVQVSQGNDSTGSNCMCEMCDNLDADLLEAFSEYMDYTEVEKYDKQTAQYNYETRFLRLFLSPGYSWQEKEYAGPVFRYDQVEKLFPAPVFYNRLNDAAPFTLKQIFANRVYAPELKPGKDMTGRVNWENDLPEMEMQDLWEQ